MPRSIRLRCYAPRPWQSEPAQDQRHGQVVDRGRTARGELATCGGFGRGVLRLAKSLADLMQSDLLRLARTADTASTVGQTCRRRRSVQYVRTEDVNLVPAGHSTTFMRRRIKGACNDPHHIDGARRPIRSRDLS